jgi:hypothetical protein
VEERAGDDDGRPLIQSMPEAIASDPPTGGRLIPIDPTSRFLKPDIAC